MKRNAFYFIIIIFLFACKSKKKIIEGHWYITKMEINGMATIFPYTTNIIKFNKGGKCVLPNRPGLDELAYWEETTDSKANNTVVEIKNGNNDLVGKYKVTNIKQTIINHKTYVESLRLEKDSMRLYLYISLLF